MPDSISRRILLVEDEAILAMNEKMELEKFGYSVSTVTTGEKAIEAVRTSSDIDLVLMDINLGTGIDGTQAAEIILKSREIPVVFLSSHTDPEIVEKTEKITSYGYVVKSSSITVLDASIKMALKLFDAVIKKNEKEESLRQSEQKYRTLFNEMLDGFALHEIICDSAGVPVDYRFLDVNPVFERMTGLKAADIVGRTVLEAMPGTEKYWIETYGRVALSGEPVVFENYASAIGKHFLVRAIRPAANHFACVFEDITERKNTEERLKASEELLAETESIGKVGGWSFNIDTLELKWTDEVYRIHEVDIVPSTNVDTGINFYTKESRPIIERAVQRAIEYGENYDLDLEIVTAKGNVRAVHTIGMADLKNRRIYGFFQDITDRKKAEDEIKKQLSEKETLLREVHHRVKNSIANIQSLLSLQAGSSASAEVKAALQDSIFRVQSLRILYDKLLLSDDLHEVSLKTYAEGLVDSLVMAFDPDKNVIIEKHISDLKIDAKKAFFIGIIINELLTNVFKYAFRNHDQGMVSVCIDKKEGHVTIVIRDNGCGFDEKALENKSPGFGRTIVRMLAEQLDGTYSSGNDDGAWSVVRFGI